jgi:hypothetical protein
MLLEDRVKERKESDETIGVSLHKVLYIYKEIVRERERESA